MKLELNKNELERALIALGKLVSRTASLPQFRSLKIEATEKEIRFSTCTPLEQITFRMESPSEEPFHCIVPFEEFRMALRSCRNKTLELEYGEGILRVGETTFLHEQSVEWPIICKGEQEAYSELPKEFVSLLATAAPLVDREEARAIMRGINLSPWQKRLRLWTGRRRAPSCGGSIFPAKESRRQTAESCCISRFR